MLSRRRIIESTISILILITVSGCGKPQRPADERERAADARREAVPDTIFVPAAIDTTNEGPVLPPGFPSDVPIVPGSVVVEASSTPDTEGHLSEITLTTPSAPTDVVAWYRRMLPRSGWMVVGETSLPDGHSLSAAQGPSTLDVTVESDADSANLEGARVRTVVWKIDP